MSEKVKLPKEVAEAIEHYRGKGYSDASIIVTAMTNGTMVGHAKSLTTYVLVCNPDMLLSALVNGYEVEPTPEEDLRKFYEDTSEKYEVGRGTIKELVAKAEMGAIKKTLYILGIEIEGVNG